MTDSPAASGPAPTPPAGAAGHPFDAVEPDAPSGNAPGASTPPARALDFAKTLETYEPKLLRYAARLLSGTVPGPADGPAPSRDTQPADLVQEAFLRLHRFGREHGGNALQHPGTWLYRVVHNLAMDALRKRIRRRGAQPKLEDAARRRALDADQSDADALGQLEQREQIDLALRLLGDLPQRQQQVITLKLLDGLTLRQIATVLDASPGSVNYHLNQGLARLAQQLKERGAV